MFHKLFKDVRGFLLGLHFNIAHTLSNKIDAKITPFKKVFVREER